MYLAPPSGSAIYFVRQSYNRMAAAYDADRNNWDNQHLFEKLSALLPKNGKVLDVGCGSGVPVAQFLAKQGFLVTGIDLSESMLEMARSNVPKGNFIQKSMTELDFPEQCFDGIVACYSIIHVPRQLHRTILESFKHILRPGGILLFSCGSSEWEGIEDFYGEQMFWSHFNSDVYIRYLKELRFKLHFAEPITGGGETHFWIMAEKA